MANYVMLDVLEVVRVYDSQTKPSSNGVVRNIKCAQINVEGGTISRIVIADGLQVPEGWSGHCACEVRSKSLAVRYPNGDSGVKYYLEPVLMFKFVPIADVRKNHVAFDNFFSVGGNQTSHK